MKLGTLTRKWWFYLLLLFICFIPSYTEKQSLSSQTPLIIQQVLQAPMVNEIKVLFPIAKTILLFLFIGPILFKERYKPAYYISIIVLSLFITVFQNISVKTQFGIAVLIGNIIIQLIAISFWCFDFTRKQKYLPKLSLKWWNILTLLLAAIAFWMPNRNGLIYFDLKDLFVNEAGLTYCMTTPIFISAYLLFFKTNNNITIRVVSSIGLYFGVMNMITWFLLNTHFWWMGIIHLPLLINSLIGLIIAFRKAKNIALTNASA
jgi:hypothetical protein